MKKFRSCLNLIFALKALTVMMVALVSQTSEGALRTLYAANPTEFRSLVANAVAGDLIIVKPGIYSFGSRVYLSRAGTASQPIEIRGEPGAIFQSLTVEMMTVTAPYWRISNLTMEGRCGSTVECEHAIHIVGNGHYFQLKNSTTRDFSAHIKSNGSNDVFPSYVLVEGNHMYNTRGRATSNVNAIDVVGGSDWVIRGNVFADFLKTGGNYIAYAAFLKGESKNGLFENNLVSCRRDLVPSAGMYQIGLSFGGGRTGDAYCAGGKCDYEHLNGTMRNNVILNCNDVGIYINKAQNSRLINNTLAYTRGIDILGTNATGTKIYNNVLSRIGQRDGMTYTGSNNLILANSGSPGVDLEDIFMTPAAGDLSIQSSSTSLINKGKSMLTATSTLPAVTKDFCGQSRDSTPDIGAIQYTSGTTCAPYIKKLFDM